MRFSAASRFWGFVGFSVVFFITLAVLSHFFLIKEHRLEEQQKLERALADFSLLTSERVQQAIEHLRGVSFMFAFNENVTYEAFQAYTLKTLNNSHNWSIIEWQPVVLASERENFETYVKENLFPDFTLWQIDEKGEAIPAANREEHVPVLFMVATSPQSNTTGLDLAWSHERMLSKHQARDEGQAKLSELFNLVLSRDGGKGPLGFAVTIPVFKNALIPEEVALRRQNIKGYIAGVYTIQDLLSRELASKLDDQYQIKIRDDKTDKNAFFWPNKAVAKEAYTYIASKKLTLFGREWNISFESPETSTHFSLMKLWNLIPLSILGFALVFLLILQWLYKNNRKLKRIEATLGDTLERVRISEKKFAEQANRDPLTNLLNRRAFYNSFDQEISRAQRYDEPLTLLLLDIDNFKSINDTHGHLIGDKVLLKLADICNSLIRSTDKICRFGGEEFSILFMHTHAQEAYTFSERLRIELANTKLEIETIDEPLRFTVSGGIASLRKSDNAQSLIDRADQAMYQSKRNGKNQISVYD